MAVAAKIIGAVCLGLVNIREVRPELNMREMHVLPDIHMLLHDHCYTATSLQLFPSSLQTKQNRGPWPESVRQLSFIIVDLSLVTKRP